MAATEKQVEDLLIKCLQNPIIDVRLVGPNGNNFPVADWDAPVKIFLNSADTPDNMVAFMNRGLEDAKLWEASATYDSKSPVLFNRLRAQKMLFFINQAKSAFA